MAAGCAVVRDIGTIYLGPCNVDDLLFGTYI